jgi:hypothetical protein
MTHSTVFLRECLLPKQVDITVAFTVLFVEMTKITISNQSHKSYRKYKSENGRTRTSEYIRGGIKCHRGVSIPC